MKKSILREYARLIARTGVNVQKGQEVFIAAELDQPEFVKLLVEECYRCKAKKVVVDWKSPALQKLHYRYRTLTTLCPSWTTTRRPAGSTMWTPFPAASICSARILTALTASIRRKWPRASRPSSR